MKSIVQHVVRTLCVLALLQKGHGEPAGSSTLETKLEAFATYEFGQPKNVLHDARMAAYRATDDDLFRQQNEKLLVGFVESEATVDARRAACLWLGVLGSETSKPVLTRLLDSDDFVDVAQISLDALGGKTIGVPGFVTPQALFEAEVRKSREPLSLLVAAWRGHDELRSRVAFELMREGALGPEAAGWLADHVAELSPQRQVIAMNVLLDADSPQRVKVLDALSRRGEGDVQRAAVRNLGFLQRQKDVPFLMDCYWEGDAAMAESARLALLTVPLPLIQEPLMAGLRASDPSRQAKAIELAGWTQAASATEPLLLVSGDETNPNRSAATRALGKVAPPGMLEEMFDRFIRSVGSPLENSYKQALWDLVRKQPDYDATQRMLRSHAAEAESESARKNFISLGKRLERLVTENRKP